MADILRLPERVHRGRRRRLTEERIDSGWDNERRHVGSSGLIQPDRGTEWHSLPAISADDSYEGRDPESY